MPKMSTGSDWDTYTQTNSIQKIKRNLDLDKSLNCPLASGNPCKRDQLQSCKNCFRTCSFEKVNGIVVATLDMIMHNGNGYK